MAFQENPEVSSMVVIVDLKGRDGAVAGRSSDIGHLWCALHRLRCVMHIAAHFDKARCMDSKPVFCQVTSRALG